MCACMLSCFSHVRLCMTLWTIACQAPLPMGFSRQEYWSGLLSPPGDLPHPGIISLQTCQVSSRNASSGRRHLRGDSGLFSSCPPNIHGLRRHLGCSLGLIHVPHPTLSLEEPRSLPTPSSGTGFQQLRQHSAADSWRDG